MGRPPGRIQDHPFQMRVSEEFLKAIDKWRAKHRPLVSRAEAIRRLVEFGLKSSAGVKKKGKGKRRRHVTLQNRDGRVISIDHNAIMEALRDDARGPLPDGSVDPAKADGSYEDDAAD
jgi:hypothetical protein